jgi:hypothetical protein
MLPLHDAGFKTGEARTASSRLIPFVLVVAISLIAASACGTQTSENDAARTDTVPGGDESELGSVQSVPTHGWLPEDWKIFDETVRWAWSEGIDTVSLGSAVARIGLRFVGTPYEPGTLEVDGPEALVVNFRALDCVTFVENVIALTSFVRAHDVDVLRDSAQARRRYEAKLSEVRYRPGFADKYESRFHYFSEWLAAHADDGWLELVAADLGGRSDEEPVYFMSANPQAYRQLSDAATLNAIRAMERQLNVGDARMFLPEGELMAAVQGVREGDVIAATSTVPGLDIAHTGIAVRFNGAIHLLHAPLVGDSVEVSVEPLAARIQSISSQDGIMVGRPVDGPWFGGR